MNLPERTCSEREGKNRALSVDAHTQNFVRRNRTEGFLEDPQYEI
jgi:hypothetical protein